MVTDMLTDITRFANPGMLWLLLVLPFLIALYIYRLREGSAAMTFTTIQGVDRIPKTFRYWLRHLPFVLRLLAMALVIIALARPQAARYTSSSTTDGIDIMLAIDVSGSMLARDFKPDRMTAARETAAAFVNDRPHDRIGLVIFAGESFTQCPLTTDKRTLLNLLGGVRSGIIEDGTAIGNGLATSVNRLRESDAASKVIILLTDGVNNRGQIAPLTAAEIAAEYGIKVYTIGVGSRGMAPMPMIDMWGRMVFQQQPVEIDEEILMEIASITDGEYFRATDNSTLTEVYERINRLETSAIEVTEYVNYEEKYLPWVIATLVLLLLEVFTTRLLLRRIP